MMARAAPTRRVFLVGFMGAGKTTVGRILARRLRWSFYDLDDVIEEAQKRSIAAIFADTGEAAFRGMESAALRDLLAAGDKQESGRIVALGGGAFAQPENRKTLERSGGLVVLLEAPVEELQRRCAREAGKRPLAGDPAKFSELHAARRLAYDLVRLRVDTMNKSVEEVAAEIERLLAEAASMEVKQ